MSKAKDKPNFTISYRTPCNVDYEEFKKDFCNKMVSVGDMKKKYDMTPSEFHEYRSRVMEETGLKRKPTYTYKPIHFYREAEYIQKKDNGYIIAKTWTRNHKSFTRYYGRYEDYDTAKLVRDRLVESDWDDYLADYLKNTYGMDRNHFRPAYDRAVEIYPEFKKLYFSSSMKVTEILEQFNATQRVYLYLINMIREEMGDKDFRRVPRR